MENTMNKSELKHLIREVIEEVTSENKLTAQERKSINHAIQKIPELGGNKKVDGVGKGVSILAKVLDILGFQLDMVSGDLLLGQKGQRLLRFRRKSTGTDPFTEGPAIENSGISFAWENMTQDQFGTKVIEIVAYAS